MEHFNFKKLAFLMSCALAVTITGCQKDPGGSAITDPEPVNKVAPDGFNYSTSKTVTIDIRLLTNNNQPISGVPVNVFSTKATANNASLFKTVSDANGHVTGTLSIPAYLDTLLVKTNYIGLPTDVRIKVVNNQLSATIGGENGVSGNVALSAVEGESGVIKLNSSASTFGSTFATTFNYPSPYSSSDAFKTTGGYDQSDGRPLYIIGKDVITNNLLKYMNASLPEGRALGSTHPDYLSSAAVNTVNMVKNSDVWVTFVSEGAGYRNTLAYYIYDTSTPPTTANAIASATYVFPNASGDAGAALVSGDKVKIGTIPAGKSVGFILLQDGWRDGAGPKVKGKNIWGVKTDNQKFYSHLQLNPESTASLKKHSVMLYDDEHKLFLMGFEDCNRQNPSANVNSYASDNDFNDLVIYITSNPVDGISKDGVPNIDKGDDLDRDGVIDQLDEFPTDPAKAYNNYYPTKDTYATLAFEDNWPATGDYDLNDLVVKYRYNRISNASNQVVELVADYDVVASGATYKNGFGVQFPFSSSLVSEVTGQKIGGSYIQLAANGVEAGQSKAVIIPFDDQNQVIKNADGTDHVNTMLNKDKVTGQPIQVKVKFASPVDVATFGSAPFNPFLISNGRRGYEIHLPGFNPTDKADRLLFGTEADNSSEATNRYYLTNDNWPWALNFTEEFTYPKEYSKINQAYLHFLEWARSGGTMYTDWYKNAATEYRSTSHIYSK